MRLSIIALACFCATGAFAERYTLSLGGGAIGTLDHDAQSIRSNVTGSPLGVGNGTFEASAKRVRMADGRVVTQYLSNSPSKGRRISVLHDGGQTIETTVSPGGDATALSDAAAVPQGVTDPVAALSIMLGDRTTCPGTIRFYEGRRVITVSPTGSRVESDTLRCDMAYRVTAGPGHFSPLFIKNATVELTYTGGRFGQLAISSGPFTLNVTP